MRAVGRQERRRTAVLGPGVPMRSLAVLLVLLGGASSAGLAPQPSELSVAPSSIQKVKAKFFYEWEQLKFQSSRTTEKKRGQLFSDDVYVYVTSQPPRAFGNDTTDVEGGGLYVNWMIPSLADSELVDDEVYFRDPSDPSQAAQATWDDYRKCTVRNKARGLCAPWRAAGRALHHDSAPTWLHHYLNFSADPEVGRASDAPRRVVASGSSRRASPPRAATSRSAATHTRRGDETQTRSPANTARCASSAPASPSAPRTHRRSLPPPPRT